MLEPFEKSLGKISTLCIRCKGKNLCGKPCPILERLNVHKVEIARLKENFNASGVSPFVGRAGYPEINIGLLSPASVSSDAWKLDAPTFWYEKSYGLEDIMDARTQLIHSRERTSVRSETKTLEVAQEIAMAAKPPSTEFFLKKKPYVAMQLDLTTPPIGAPAILKAVKLEENPHVLTKVDKIVSDELKAVEAMNELYGYGIDVNQLMRILSVGLLGLKSQKKLVPTRWSITATDDMLAKSMLKEIRRFDTINTFELYVNEYLGNKFYILFMPGTWTFELIELWYGNSLWNPTAAPAVSTDYENFFGRKNYASNCEGGYYAVRFAVAEYLSRIRRQASVLVLREVMPEYSVPVGVWECRENVRSSFSCKKRSLESKEHGADGITIFPYKETFATLDEALKHVRMQTKKSIDSLLKASNVLGAYRQQRTLRAWF
ncbi:MAG: hypothetical protein ABIG30_02605 [Candidatus Aenigmatarchaeota archaeon]